MIKLKFKSVLNSCSIFTYIKISKKSSAKYYQHNKERIQKKACERYQSLFKEEKEKKRQQCDQEL